MTSQVTQSAHDQLNRLQGGTTEQPLRSTSLDAIDERIERLTANVVSRGDEMNKGAYTVRLVPGSKAVPDDLVALRKAVYQGETGLLQDSDLFDENDAKGAHFLVYDNVTNELIASTTVVDGERSDFSKHTGIPASVLTHTFYSTRSTVLPDYRKQGMFSFLLYLALRHYRAQGRAKLVCFCEPGNIPAQKILQYTHIERARPRKVVGKNGQEYTVLPFECRIDDALVRTFSRLSPELKTWVKENCFVNDVIEKTRSRVNAYYETPYYQLIAAKRLSKQQYLNALANTHQFVRWTTRILGHAVAMCADPDIRRHYAGHLSGEVNHEIWIEDDLNYLGGDVEFVKNSMVANSGTQKFMFCQEALAAFHQDPIVFMGVPIAIEGITAFMDQAFVNNLRACVSSWGYSKPSQATSFFASHVHTDGADEGHWAGTIQMLSKYVDSEQTMQRVLTIMDIVFDALTEAYNQFVAEPDLSMAVDDALAVQNLHVDASLLTQTATERTLGA